MKLLILYFLYYVGVVRSRREVVLGTGGDKGDKGSFPRVMGTEGDFGNILYSMVSRFVENGLVWTRVIMGLKGINGTVSPLYLPSPV